MSKRPHGTGRVLVKHGSYYGSWRVGGTRLTRKIGPVRPPGSREGLTQKMAEARLREMMQDSEAAPPPVAERLTVADVGAQLVTHLTIIGRKRSTVGSIESHLRVHIAPYFPEALVDITDTRVEAFIAHQLAAGRAVNSVLTDIAVLRRTINFAITKRWANANPVTDVAKPKDPHRVHEIRYLDKEDLEALLRAARDTHRYSALVRQRIAQLPSLREEMNWKQIAAHFEVHPATIVYYKGIADPDEIEPVSETWWRLEGALYTTAAFAGLRQGELIALRWRDVDWANAQLRVAWNYARGEFGTTKGGRERNVPMIDRVGAALDELSRHSARTGRDDLVFGHPHTGKPLDRSALLRRYKRALKRAGLDTRPFHDLRHTFGTMVAQSGEVSVRDLQEYMGHADIQTTQRYMAFAPRLNQAAALGRALGQADSKTDSNLSETHPLSDTPTPVNTGGMS